MSARVPVAGDGARMARTLPPMPVLISEAEAPVHVPVEMCRCGRRWPCEEQPKSVPQASSVGEKEIK